MPEVFDRCRDHTGRCEDLPEQHLLDCNWSLPYLDEHGVHYYVPAVMCFDLRYGLAAPGGWLIESLEQRATIAAYTLVSGNTKAFEAWGRVMEMPQNNTPEQYL